MKTYPAWSCLVLCTFSNCPIPQHLDLLRMTRDLHKGRWRVEPQSERSMNQQRTGCANTHKPESYEVMLRYVKCISRKILQPNHQWRILYLQFSAHWRRIVWAMQQWDVTSTRSLTASCVSSRPLTGSAHPHCRTSPPKTSRPKRSVAESNRKFAVWISTPGQKRNRKPPSRPTCQWFNGMPNSSCSFFRCSVASATSWPAKLSSN